MRFSVVIIVCLSILVPALISCSPGTKPANRAYETVSQKPKHSFRFVTVSYYDMPVFKNGEWVPGDGSPSVERYEYDEQGRKIAMYRDQYLGEQVTHIKQVFVYKDGKFFEREIWADSVKEPSSTQWESDSTYREIFFDQDGKMESEYWYAVNADRQPIATKFYTSDGKLFTSETHTYDSRGNLAQQTIGQAGEEPNTTVFKILTSDSLGNPLKTLKTTTRSGTISHSLEIRSYEYF